MPPDGCVVALVAFAVLAVSLAVSLVPVPPLIEPQLALLFLSSSSSARCGLLLFARRSDRFRSRHLRFLLSRS